MSNNIRTVSVDWVGGMRFQGGAPGGPQTTVDADTGVAPGPMQFLLIAAVGCAGADIVSILEKMQVKLTKLHTEAIGTRAEDHPRKYVAITLRFTFAGEGLDRNKAERAVSLSVTKYCSVIQSLDPATPITTEIVIE
ncbi:MAG: OsmC family protein [Gemmatimonadales bacterium]|nr:OsmC family protein [Gemmatimonadales bacterium]